MVMSFLMMSLRVMMMSSRVILYVITCHYMLLHVINMSVRDMKMSLPVNTCHESIHYVS